MEQAVLLKSVRVHDPKGPWHNQVVDVLLDQGQIADVAANLDAPQATSLHVEGSSLSVGWIDGQAHFREPGEETKEGIASGLNAAALGGFTSVAVLPSTCRAWTTPAPCATFWRCLNVHTTSAFPRLPFPWRACQKADMVSNSLKCTT